ncbi:MAG: transposase [Deltaproteobacteria bacterium]|nr:transposase [Deltaproteobacteria bacterium]
MPGLPAAHDGYVELYRNDDVAVFQYEATKEGEVLQSKLAGFHGTLTADAEHRFNGVYASGDVVEAGCNAYGRRKFEAAEATQPTLAFEGAAAHDGVDAGEEGPFVGAVERRRHDRIQTAARGRGQVGGGHGVSGSNGS